MEVDRNIIYSYTFNLNSDMAPQAKADNIWRHFQKFHIRHHNKIVYVTQAPADKTPFILATMEYNEPLPPMKPEYNPKIMFTHAGHLDHMSLRRQYEQAQTRLTYAAWLKSIRIPDLMKKHNIKLVNPAAFNTIPEGPIRIFFIQEWEMFYSQIQRTFDTWFLGQGWTLQLPTQFYQERNEQVRYQIPNLDDEWPSQADFQPENGQPTTVNDYRQIIIDTDFERQQEVVQITVTIGHPEGWDWEASPLTIPTNQVREVLDKLCQANETKLDSLAADQRLNKGILYHTMSDKYNAKLEIIIQPEVGPHGRERMVNIKRESHGQQQMVKVPWIQLPRFIEHLTSLMDEYELTPLDVRHS